jgi:hypothetical protein
MKRQSLTVFMLLSLIVAMAAGPVNAQSLNFTLDVGFKFNIGDKELPAGRYTIRRSPLGADDILMFQSKDGRVSEQVRMKIFFSNEAAKENKKLIFIKYGDQRFLSEIWAISPLGKSTRYMVKKSKQEQELEKKAKQDQAAQQPEMVSIVVK